MKKFEDGEVLYAEDLNIISNAVDDINNVLDIKKESYIEEVVHSTNLFDCNRSDIMDGYQTYVANSNISSSHILIVGQKDKYVDVPPAIATANYASRISDTVAWTNYLVPYLKVEVGKTYMLKATVFPTYVDSSGTTRKVGDIKWARIIGTDGKCYWELKNYNAKMWNVYIEDEEQKIQTGTSTDTAYGTKFAELKYSRKVSGSNFFDIVIIKSKIDGWLSFTMGRFDIANYYGGVLPSVADKIPEELARLSLNGLIYADVTSYKSMSEAAALPFEEYRYEEVEKQKYVSALDAINDNVNYFKSQFKEIPTYSPNLYNPDFFTDYSNRYISLTGGAVAWGVADVATPNGIQYSKTGTQKYGKNIFSGWVKLTTAGLYVIRLFKLLIAQDDTGASFTFGYIGIVFIVDATGHIQYMSNNYFARNTDYTIAYSDSVENDYIKGTALGASSTLFKFTKKTDDIMFVGWFMSMSAGKSPSGYDFTTNRPIATPEEIMEIRNNTMIILASSCKTFIPYSADPIAYDYLLPAERVYGLASLLDGVDLSELGSTSGNSNVETITITNSDKIGFFGNSFMLGYVLRGLHPTIHLGSYFDYLMYNYSKSGDDILETLERVETDSNSPFGNELKVSDWNLTYNVIALQDNDGALHGFNATTYYENAKKLANYLSATGSKCILGTEHDSNSYYYNFERLAEEEGYMHMTWGPHVSYLLPTGYAPITHSGHPSTRTHWTWTLGMKLYFETLPRPNKAVKIFICRDDNMSDNDLLYGSNLERSRLWQDLSGNYTCYNDKIERYFERLNDSVKFDSTTGEIGGDNKLTVLSSVNHKSEYMALQYAENDIPEDPEEEYTIEANVEVNSNRVLIEFITPYTSQNLQSMTVKLNTTASDVYVMRMAKLVNSLSSKRYLAFGIGNNAESLFVTGATLTVAAGTDGHVQGSTIAGTYTIQGVDNGYVFTTKMSPTETSGTDVFNSCSVNGVTIGLMLGSYDYPSSDYAARYDVPLCEWIPVTPDEKNEVTFDQKTLKTLMRYDKVAFLLKDSTDITLNHVMATIVGNGCKKERYYNCKSVKKFATSNNLMLCNSSTTWNAHTGIMSYASAWHPFTYTTTDGTSRTESAPTSTYPIEILSNKILVSNLFFPNTDNSYDYFGENKIQIQITCRYAPPQITTDELWESTLNKFGHKNYMCRQLKVGVKNTNSIAKESTVDWLNEIEVAPWWFTHIVETTLYTNGNEYLTLYTNSENIQIARIAIFKI